MEEDIFSMATEPINMSNSSMYEEETQAIIGAFDSSSLLNQPEKMSSRSSNGSYCDGSPTQKLDLSEKEKYIGSYIVQAQEESKAENQVDSDCETIPASPVFDLNPIEEDIRLQRGDISRFSLPEEGFNAQSPIPGSPDLKKQTKSGKAAATNLIQDQDLLDFPTQPLFVKNKVLSDDDSQGVPTDSLPQVKGESKPETEDLGIESTQMLISNSTKCNMSATVSGADSPFETFNETEGSETSMDAPTQKLPESKILIAVDDETSMDAPTQPLPRKRQAFILSDNENSMDAPTQPLPQERKVCLVTCNENSMDVPTQPLPVRRKGIVISDNEDSMDAVTQPLPKSQAGLRENPSIPIPSPTPRSDSEEMPASPTLDLGLQLPLANDESNRVTSPTPTTLYDDETQRIDFDPHSLFDPCQAGALSSMSPVPTYGATSIKNVNLVSASSTPYQTKKKASSDLFASPSRKNHEKGTSSNYPSEQKEEESDVETLPGSPGLDFGTPSDVVPCSQEEEDEELSSDKHSSVWKALQNTGEPGNQANSSGGPEKSALASSDASRKKVQTKDIKENQPVSPKASNPKVQHHETATPSRDETNCESPVFDFDDTSEPIVDETQAASPLSYSMQGTPPVIAETPYIRDGESPRKKRKIIRRSGYTINNSTFLQISTISEDTMTEKAEEGSPTPRRSPQHLDLGSESELSDLELTFASHYSSAPTSTKEPFVGFTNDDREHISNNLKLLRTVIDADERDDEVDEVLQNQQPSTSGIVRRSTRRSAPNLRNSDLYEMNNPGPSGQSKLKRPCRASRSSTSSVSNSAVDMDIASSDEGEQGPCSGVARKRRTVSKTPSTTNVTVDMEITSSGGEQEQDEDTPKAGVSGESRRSKRSSAATAPRLTTSISAGSGPAANVSDPEVAKGALKPIRKTRSKRSPDAIEAVPELNSPKAVRASEPKQIGNEHAEQQPSAVVCVKVETGGKRGKRALYNTRMKTSSDSEKEEKIDHVTETMGPRVGDVTLPIVPTKADSSCNVNAEQPPSRKKQVGRTTSEKALNNKQEDAALLEAHPIKSVEKVDHVSEHPLPSEDETVVKQRKTRGRINLKTPAADDQAATLQPVSEAVESVNQQQPEPQSKRKGIRTRKGKKENDSAASESSDDAGESKQTSVTSAQSKEEQVDSGKTASEETFPLPELPVRKGRRRRVGSDASTVSNATVRSEAESSDEATTSGHQQATKRGVPSADSAESSSDEHTAGKRIRPGRQTRAASLKHNETSASDSTPQSSTPSAAKRGRGRPSKKDALNDSVSSSSGVGASQRRPPRLSNLNASVSSSPSLETSRRRKRALAGQVRVLFTVIDDENDRETVARLGGKVVTHFKDCSVLVTDRIRRTVKFLCCVGLGVPIVGLDWLEKCRASGKFLDPWLHLLRDKEGEEKFDFKLANSLRVASETPLLSGCIFHATPGVRPPPVEMQEIVDACGGFYVEENDKSIENKFVISTAEDKKIWSWLKRRGAKLIDKEAILTGVLQQSFQPEKFALGS